MLPVLLLLPFLVLIGHLVVAGASGGFFLDNEDGELAERDDRLFRLF